MKKISLLILLILTACQGVPAGILGIEVPIGNTRVSSQEPYIVVGVFEDSPADRAGVKPDDIIIQINGMPVEGMVYDDIFQNHLRGKKGEAVTLLVQRNGENLVYKIIRE